MPKPLPFTVVRKDGLVHIDRVIDQAFRQALLDGIPTALRPNMREALAALPDRNSRAHSERYFGQELPAIKQRIAPLLMELNHFLTTSLNLPGLFDWLDVTGFGNDYRMIKAFDAWAQMKLGEAYGTSHALAAIPALTEFNKLPIGSEQRQKAVLSAMRDTIDEQQADA